MSEEPLNLSANQSTEKKRRRKVHTPPISDNPLHARIVDTVTKLNGDVLIGALADATGCHRAALFLKKLLYWLSPSNTAPERPRATVYRQNKADELRDPDDISTYSYWVCISRQEWEIMGFDRWKLEKIYERCGDLVERGYFIFAAQRRTHYRIDYAKLLDIFERDKRVQCALANPSISVGKNRRPVRRISDDENERKDLEEGYKRMTKGHAETSDRSEVVPEAQKASSTEESVDEVPPPPARRPINTLPETKSIDQTITGSAGVCASSPTAPSGAAAPEPPPPARRALDSVEAPAAKPEVTTFKQAQAILQEAESDETLKEKLSRVLPYGKTTRLVVGYLLVWQAECARLDQPYRLCEAHFLQSRDFAQATGVGLMDFYRTLRAAWEVVPSEGFDPALPVPSLEKAHPLLQALRRD